MNRIYNEEEAWDEGLEESIEIRKLAEAGEFATDDDYLTSNDYTKPTRITEDGKPPEFIKSKYSRWTFETPGFLIPCGDSYPSLTPGLYLPRMGNHCAGVKALNLSTDEIHNFTGGEQERILSEIDRFWNSADSYAKSKLTHRRGYLLYGPQGSGKTMIVQRAIRDTVKRGGIALSIDDCTTGLFSTALSLVREISPRQPILCIYEDIDAIIKENGEPKFLSMLDGESQVNHCLSIATTNYVRELDPRITSRPRRFDRVIYIGYPTREERLAYFYWKLPADNPERIEQLADDTKELSFAALAEVIIATQSLGESEEACIKRLREMEKRKLIDSEKEIGFQV